MSCNYKCSVRWLVGTKHFQNSKTRPRIQNKSQKPKTHPRIQNTSQNPKHFWILGLFFGFCEVFLNSGMCFGFREVFLDSGTCFGFKEEFLNFGLCFCPISHGSSVLVASAFIAFSPFFSLLSFPSLLRRGLVFPSRAPFSITPRDS